MIWELKALACLLLYPDDDLLESLPEIDVVLQKSWKLAQRSAWMSSSRGSKGRTLPRFSPLMYRPSISASMRA